MKKIFLILLSLILLSGCSSELSPQEKRNKFDACVIRDIQKSLKDVKVFAQIFATKDLFYLDVFEISANSKCVKFLD